ncbi:MAG: IS6 family transposase [Gammaproteobacteria bacterium]|nr:IS6 family transposase [Gammaproteobacteria bacterium]
MISLKGRHFPKDAVLYAVYFRDLEEIMAKHGVQVDHATLNRWVVKYSPMIAVKAQSKKGPTLSSWRMDETYIRVRGKWMYLYRAVDKVGDTLDFMLSDRRNRPTVARFFAKALPSNGIPSKIVIDKSGANAAGIREVNKILNRFDCPAKIQTVRSKYLNNLICLPSTPMEQARVRAHSQ